MGKNSGENKAAGRAQREMYNKVSQMLDKAEAARETYRQGSSERMKGIKAIGDRALKRFEAYERGEDVASIHPMLASQIGDISKNYQALSRFTGGTGTNALASKDPRYTQKLQQVGLRDIAKTQGSMLASAGAQARERDMGEYINSQGAQVGEERFGLGLYDTGFNQAGAGLGAAGQWRSGAQAEAQRQQAAVSSGIGAGMSLLSMSDERAKSDKKKSGYGLDEVIKIQPIVYNIGGKPEVGFSAQEVEKEIPELVRENEEGMKMMDYGKMTAVHNQAISELKAEIDALKKSKKMV